MSGKRLFVCPRFLLICCYLIVLASGVACAEQSVSTVSESLPSPIRGQRLNIAISEPMMTLDWMKAFDFGSMATANAISETLYRQLLDGTMMFHLAQSSPSRLADGLYRITLREEIRFSNGDPLLAGDVVFTLDRVRNPGNNQATAALFNSLTAVAVSGPDSCDITFNGSADQLMRLLSRPETGIVSQRRVAQLGKSYGIAGVEGTGPFTSRDWEKGTQIVLEKNPHYWAAENPFDTLQSRQIRTKSASRSGESSPQNTAKEPHALPLASSIVLSHVADKALLVRRLIAGRYDIALGIDPLNIDRLWNKQERFNIMTFDRDIMVQLYCNRTSPPFDRDRLRQALSRAIDRKLLLQTAARGYGTVAQSMLPSTLWSAVPREVYQNYEVNSDEARQVVLEEAAGPGSTIPFTLRYTAEPLLEAVAAELKRQLDAIGFEVTLMPLGKQSIMNLLYKKRDGGVSPGDWQVILEDFHDWRRLGDPLSYLKLQFQSQSPYNKTGYSDERVDTMLAVEKSAMYGKIIPSLLTILQQDATVIPLFSPRTFVAASKKLIGCTWNDWKIPYLEAAWLTESLPVEVENTEE